MHRTTSCELVRIRPAIVVRTLQEAVNTPAQPAMQRVIVPSPSLLLQDDELGERYPRRQALASFIAFRQGSREGHTEYTMRQRDIAYTFRTALAVRFVRDVRRRLAEQRASAKDS